MKVYSTNCCYLMIILTSLVDIGAGSRVVLTATPSDVVEGAAHSFKLSCSLKDTSSGDIIQDRNEFSATNYNIGHVQSIAFIKGQEEIARIVYGQAPELGPPGIGATVAGNLTEDRTDHLNYLDVTWTTPVREYSGRYCCKMNALDPDGATVFLKSCIVIDFPGPSIHDLISLITEFKDALKESNREYMKTISEMNKTINDLQSTLSTLKPQHNEQGFTGFGVSSDWNKVFVTSREMLFNVNFKVPYTTPPLVSLAVSYIDADHKFNTRYHLEVRNVTNKGFQLACITWWDSIIYRLEVQWSSTGT